MNAQKHPAYELTKTAEDQIIKSLFIKELGMVVSYVFIDQDKKIGLCFYEIEGDSKDIEYHCSICCIHEDVSEIEEFVSFFFSKKYHTTILVSEEALSPSADEKLRNGICNFMNRYCIMDAFDLFSDEGCLIKIKTRNQKRVLASIVKLLEDLIQ